MKTAQPLTPKRITTRAAATMSGLSPSTILRACEAKKIRGFKTPGGHWRLEPEDVREFMRGQETGPGVRVGIATGKRAGGPFLFSPKVRDEVMKTLFAPSGSWTTFHAPGLLPEQANRFLLDWLKGPDGREWMKADGVSAPGEKR